MRAVAALVLSLCACSREPKPKLNADVAPNAMAPPSAEQQCRITGERREPMNVRFTPQDGRELEVARGDECVVLDRGPSQTLVRMTSGRYARTVGWVPSAKVGK